MIGAVVASSPSARYARMPTTVLAARHMRRATSLIQPQREGRPSADDEAAPGPHRLSSGSGGATPAVPLASPSAPPAPSSSEPAAAARHLGTGLPAVAVSQQAGQPAEEVLLFFGIIDFLQVGAGPQLLSCVLLLSCVHVCAILLSRALLTLGPASLMTPTSSTRVLITKRIIACRSTTCARSWSTRSRLWCRTARPSQVRLPFLACMAPWAPALMRQGVAATRWAANLCRPHSRHACAAARVLPCGCRRRSLQHFCCRLHAPFCTSHPECCYNAPLAAVAHTTVVEPRSYARRFLKFMDKASSQLGRCLPCSVPLAAAMLPPLLLLLPCPSHGCCFERCLLASARLAH